MVSVLYLVLCSVFEIPNMHGAAFYTAAFSHAFIFSVCLKKPNCTAGFEDEGAVHGGISIVFDLQYSIFMSHHWRHLFYYPIQEYGFSCMFDSKQMKCISSKGTVLSASQIASNNLEDLLILQATLVEAERHELEQGKSYTAHNTGGS